MASPDRRARLGLLLGASLALFAASEAAAASSTRFPQRPVLLWTGAQDDKATEASLVFHAAVDEVDAKAVDGKIPLLLKANFHHGVSSNICQVGTLNPSDPTDGCEGQTPNGSAYFPDMWTNTTTGFRQSGQTYAAIPTGNKPAINYPVGLNTVIAYIPASTYSGWTANNCKVDSGALGEIDNGAFIRCGVNSAPLSTPLVTGIDFSPDANGGRCYYLKFSTSNLVGGTVTIDNNRFKNGTGCDGIVGGNAGVLVGDVANGGNVSLVFTHNDMDGNYANFPGTLTGPMLSWQERNASMTVKWNYLHDSGNDPVSGEGDNMVIDFEDNIFARFAEDPTAHGAVFVMTPQTTSAVTSRTFHNNICFYEGGSRAVTGTTCFSILGKHAASSVFSAETFTDNIMVSNKTSTGAHYTTSTVMLEALQGSQITLLDAERNFVDATGAQNGCVSNLGDASGVTGSISGTTLTVTAQPTGGIYPGAGFAQISTLYGVIQPYGTIDPLTGSPSTGMGTNANLPATYVLSQSTTSASFTNGRTTNTPVGTLIFPTSGPNANIDMPTGEVETVNPSTASVQGLQWALGNCPSKFNGTYP